MKYKVGINESGNIWRGGRGKGVEYKEKKTKGEVGGG